MQLLKSLVAMLIVSLAITTNVSAQTVSPYWHFLFSDTQTPSVDELVKMVSDNSGNVYVTAARNRGNHRGDIETFKQTVNGAVAWKATYYGRGKDDDVPVGIGYDAAGNTYVGASVYVSSYRNASGVTISLRNISVLKYSPAGTLLWTYFYTRDTTQSYATDMKVDLAGNITIAGVRDTHPVVIRLNADGGTVWTNTTNGVSTPQKICVDASLNVFVASTINVTTLGSPAQPDLAVAKYDPDGNIVWNSYWSYGANWNDRPTAIRVDPFGDILVCGYTYMSSNETAILLKFSSEGSSKWSVNYTGTTEQIARFNALATDGTGNVYVCGNARVGSTTVLAAKYSPEGVYLWRRLSTGINGSNATDVVVDNRGNPYFTGYYYTGYPYLTGARPVTTRYTPAGTQVWSVSYAPLYPQMHVMAQNISLQQRNSPIILYEPSIYLAYQVRNNPDWPGDLDILVSRYTQSAGIAPPIAYQNKTQPALSNFPNPSTGHTTIRYDVPEDAQVQIIIYDLNGRQLRTAVNGFRKAGHYSEDVDLTGYGKGLYHYEMQLREGLVSKTISSVMGVQ